MKRSTKWALASWALMAVLGFLLIRAGLFLDDWVFWAVILVVSGFGFTCGAQGYNHCKEGLTQEISDDIRKMAEEILGDGKSVSVELEITG